MKKYICLTVVVLLLLVSVLVGCTPEEDKGDIANTDKQTTASTTAVTTETEASTTGSGNNGNGYTKRY